jgi:hypothetical protein
MEGLTEKEALMKCLTDEGIERINALGPVTEKKSAAQTWTALFEMLMESDELEYNLILLDNNVASDREQNRFMTRLSATYLF